MTRVQRWVVIAAFIALVAVSSSIWVGGGVGRVQRDADAGGAPGLAATTASSPSRREAGSDPSSATTAEHARAGGETKRPTAGGIPPPAEDTAAGHFRRGERLVEMSRGDAADASKEALEEAVRDLQRAIELRYGDTSSAYFLMGEAFRSIALVQLPPQSGEKEKYLELARGAYRKAIEANAADLNARVALAELLPRGQERSRQLREIVRLDPDNTIGLYSLGFDLVESGERAEGASLLERAVQRFGLEDLDGLGPVVVDLLRSKGMEADARRVEEIVRDRKRKLGGASEAR